MRAGGLSPQTSASTKQPQYRLIQRDAFLGRQAPMHRDNSASNPLIVNWRMAFRVPNDSLSVSSRPDAAVTR